MNSNNSVNQDLLRIPLNSNTLKIALLLLAIPGEYALAVIRSAMNWGDMGGVQMGALWGWARLGPMRLGGSR